MENTTENNVPLKAIDGSDADYDEEFATLFAGRFRVLIVGRANAGKTTILERLCGSSIDQAQIVREGKMTNIKMKKGEAGRGDHSITDELWFPSRPRFVFHDSCGIESGSQSETGSVWDFIHARASGAKDRRQLLHAIWVCIPLDNDRPLAEEEVQFLQRSTGKVPVIVIFTKLDGRIIKCIGSTDGMNRSEKRKAREEASQQAEDYVRDLQQKLKAVACNSPSAYITCGDMDKRGELCELFCEELVNQTRKSLPSALLQLLITSASGRKKMTERIEYAIRWLLFPIIELKGNKEWIYDHRLISSITMCFEYNGRNYDDYHYDDYYYNKKYEEMLNPLLENLQPDFPKFTSAEGYFTAVTLCFLLMLRREQLGEEGRPLLNDISSIVPKESAAWTKDIRDKILLALRDEGTGKVEVTESNAEDVAKALAVIIEENQLQ